MTKNPYSVLGVSENATDDEIKDAYRTLAKKYHPDRYIDEGLKEMATQKMQEINEAYDAIKDLRAGRKSTGGGFGGFGGFSSEGNAHSSFAQIRVLINNGAYAEAERALDAVAESDRNAEWYFLRGCILLRRGWYHDATSYFDTACRMDPYNTEYRNARLQMEKMSTDYNRTGENICGSGSTVGSGMSACDCCQTLICADCCCECMGGNLIPCC